MLPQPLQQFLDTEAASGIVLLGAAVVAVAWASSPWSSAYDQLWSHEVAIGTASFGITEDLRHWVNDLAMALFFFVAGLEIKRELVHGDLRSVRSATLPIVCAVGGMVVPALVFLAIAGYGDGARGWGIPMATDIAFSIGVLSLVGRRTPASLKVFLLTLAIVDDIGAIVVIALFYSAGLEIWWLGAAAVIVTAIVLLRAAGVRALVPYGLLAAGLWIATFESGVHATIAGVVLGLLTPARATRRPAWVRRAVVDRRRTREALPDADAGSEQDEHDDRAGGEGAEDVEELETVTPDAASPSAEAVSPVARLERALHPYSSFVVLPLFALANAGVDLTPDDTATSLTSTLSLGIVVGLVAGKPLGILLAAFVAVRLGRATLPPHAGWVELAGVGLLAGIGFTVSLFVTGLAFDGSLAAEAKLAILVASVVAGAAGAALLAARATAHPLVGGPET